MSKKHYLRLCFLIAGCQFLVSCQDAQASKTAAASVTATSPAPQWIDIPGRKLKMLKTEVTVKQYQDCVGAGKCTQTGTEDYCHRAKQDKENHPVNCVSWAQANGFCAWMSARLPTEKEWEYAATGGKATNIYPWGDAEPTCDLVIMNDGRTTLSADWRTAGCGKDGSWPVCSRPQGNTEQGLCDMAGNILEWCDGWIDGDNVHRPKRGGGFGSHELGLRSRFAWVSHPISKGSDATGFRCAQ
jgi:formylglycine-generating enzyme required for sulfatase activity